MIRIRTRPGRRVIALLTPAFAPVTRALPTVRLGPAREAACRRPASRGEAEPREQRLSVYAPPLPLLLGGG